MRTRRRQHEARKGAAAVAVLALVLVELALTAGAVRWALTTRYRTPPPVGQVPTAALVLAVDRAPSRDRVTPNTAPRTARRAGVSPFRGVPLQLEVPRLAITASVTPVAAGAGGALTVPSDVAKVGWWRHGALPGSGNGTVVIDGHVDSASQGRGALFPLSHAEPGDSITVTTTHGQIRYSVVARRTYLKAQLPEDVFATGGRARLVLITCGGQFDPKTRHYRSNVVVYAVPSAP